jgi:RimJ/RimL family protein N-acetyltransferase
MMPPTIRSERLTLDALRPSDADAVFRYCQDADVQRWVHIPSPYTHADAEYFVTTYATDAATSAALTLWAIRSEGGALLGVIELRHEPLASATLIEYAFDPQGLDLQRVRWESFSGNYASAIVARRNGFHFEGTQRKAVVHRDVRVDTWNASLLRDDDRELHDGWPL